MGISLPPLPAFERAGGGLVLLFDRWHDAGMSSYNTIFDLPVEDPRHRMMTASELLASAGGTKMAAPIDPCIEARNAALAKLTKALEGLEADTDQIVRIAEAIAKLLPVAP